MKHTNYAGTYNISIDGERGLADISGQVDPNMLLHALGRSGQHAELVRVKLQHPASRPAIPPRHSIMSSGHDGLLMNHAYDYGTHHRSYPIHDPHWYDRKPLQPGPLSTMHHPYYTSTSSFGFDNHRLPLIRYVIISYHCF